MAIEHKELVNPVFRALSAAHSRFALTGTSILRYQPDVLPFAAVSETATVIDADDVLVHGTVFFCDVLPALSGNEATQTCFRVAQMIYRGKPHAAAPHENEVELSMANADEMVELTDVAFPGFFRVRTVQLGRYLGIRQDGRLVAMAGERFRLPGIREISAVCTRPGYTGQGFAAHLMSRLHNSIPESTFLHVTESNTRAIALYKRLGWEHARTVEVMKVERKPVS